MQNAEAQHNQMQNQPAQRQGGGAALESPQGEQIAQLEALADSSLNVGGMAQLAAAANNSPQVAAQRGMMGMIHGSPLMAAQRKAISAIHNSPDVAAQRRQLDNFSGETAQREEAEEPLQAKVTQRAEASAKPNNTGLPDNLKSGIESLSGMSMDSVRVHYNSSQPAQLNALAYAQGTDIHVGPGQEQHLPHEAWHVVQQAQGRVKPTMQMKGAAINDDIGLEAEADTMGGRAVQMVGGQKARSELITINSARNNLSYTSLQMKLTPATTVHKVDSTPTVIKVNNTKIIGKNESTGFTGFIGKGAKAGKRTDSASREVSRAATEAFAEPFIAGHMLNYHLGGTAAPENITAITAQQNSKHHSLLESKAKERNKTCDINYHVRIQRADFKTVNSRNEPVEAKNMASDMDGYVEYEEKGITIKEEMNNIKLGPDVSKVANVATSYLESKRASARGKILGWLSPYHTYGAEVQEDDLEAMLEVVMKNGGGEAKEEEEECERNVIAYGENLKNVKVAELAYKLQNPYGTREKEKAQQTAAANDFKEKNHAALSGPYSSTRSKGK